METKKDELFGTVTHYLKKWGDADKAHRKYILLANSGEDASIMRHSSMQDTLLMLSLSTLDSPETACAIKKLANLIDDLMQSEPTYQKLKDNKDLSGPARDSLFMHYFKKAIERKKAELGAAISKSICIVSDDDNDNEEEQS